MNHRRNPTSSSSSAHADLLSFDSWDYDASTVSGGQGSLLTSSMSGEDLSLCGTGQTSAFNLKNDGLLRLNVSGTTFCVEPKVFQKLERLPWKTEVTSPKATILQSNTSVNITSHHDYHLRTAPELFEILLGHVLYGSFPDVRKLRTADVEELEPLILVLELHDLYQYIQKQDHWVGAKSDARKNLVRVPSFRRRGSSNRSEPKQQKVQQSNPQDLQSQLSASALTTSAATAAAASAAAASTSSSSSSNPRNQHVRTVSQTSIQSDDGSAGGKMRRIVQKTLGRGGSQRRMTHAEWCANSGVIN